MSRKKFQKKGNKKPKSYLFEEVLRVLKKNPKKALNYKQISAELGIFDQGQKLLINSIMQNLVEKEVLAEPERGRFKIKFVERYIVGKASIITSGAAYVVSEDSDEDIYVAQRHLRNALTGDTVKVLLHPQRDGRKPEGEVVEVMERAKSQYVGTIQVNKRYAFLVPDNHRTGADIYIPIDKLCGAKDGQKAIAKIIEWPQGASNPIGEIIEVLGNAGDQNTEMHAILAEYGLPYAFPKDVEKFAELIPTEITAAEISKRRDFRGITTFTIDPVDAKDFDDALSIQKLKNGNWEVGVHIADVSHYMKENSMLDNEAIKRATSVYLVDRVVPMLPEKLSNNVCSLVPNQDRLCFSAVFEMNENAEILNEWFGRTIIHSIRRFAYEDAQKVIETGQGDLVSEIKLLHSLAQKLRAERMKSGSIAFDKLEVRFHLDKDGNPTGVFFKQMKDANKLIEDFMLLANRKVAEFVGKNAAKYIPEKQQKKTINRVSALPFVYRIHDEPNQDRLIEFSSFVKKLGYKLNVQNEKNLAQGINKLLAEASEKPEGNAIEMLAIRTMAKAIYSTDNIGHYGLGFDFYSHFTSPIRRYPDVMAHRLLDFYLKKGNGAGVDKSVKVDEKELEMKCKHSSEMEKLAAEAERSSIKYKQVQFLQDKIGQEFNGVISGVTEWGMFVEITENLCEGMVRLREMKDDMYYFDEENYCIVGRRHKRKYTLGDKVRIQVKHADLPKKQIDFVIVDADDDQPQEYYTKPKEKKPSDYQREKKNKTAAKTEPPIKSEKSQPNNSANPSNIKDEWGFDA
jgi:ribonuclease R